MLAADYAESFITLVATTISGLGERTASTYDAINGSNERQSPRLILPADGGWHVPDRSEGRGLVVRHALRCAQGRATQKRIIGFGADLSAGFCTTAVMAMATVISIAFSQLDGESCRTSHFSP